MGKSFNYRKYYKEYYGIDFGSEYDIHHIDFDRNNNDIKNLILLPKKLHNKYHVFVRSLEVIKSLWDTLYMDSNLIPEINEYIDLMCCMSEWWGLKRDFDIFFRSGVDNIKETIPEYKLPHGVSWISEKRRELTCR